MTAWPEDVVDRFLTVAGAALADPTIYTQVIRPPGPDVYDIAHCSPCGQGVAYDMEIARFMAVGRGDDPSLLPPDKPSRMARQWAQEHAAQCRALPRPTA